MSQNSFPKPAKPLRAIAFDMDGLLASSEDVYEQVGTDSLGRRGKTFDDGLRQAMMGLPGPAALQVMIDWHDLDDTVAGLITETEKMFWDIAGDRLQAMPGVVELFDRLDETDLKRGVVTSGFRAYADRVLRLIGVRDRVEFVVTADDVAQGKPHPEPFLQAVDRFGIEPAEMLVLEDSSNGCRAGVAAGAFTIAVPNLHTAAHDFPDVAFVAETLRDPRIAHVLGLP